ncbi:MAG: CHASE4 domain-containing protein [Armatimonadota bacterium]
MKLGVKVGLGILTITSVVLAFFAFIQRPIMLKSFEQLQSSAADENLRRAYEAIQTEINSLGRQAQDWGSWDDTYNYVLNRNPGYEKVNLSVNMFDTTHVDLIWLIENSGKVKHKAWRGTDLVEHTSNPGFDPVAFAGVAKELSRSSKLRGSWAIESVQGVPMILYSRPVVDSSEKAPAAGMLVMGKFLAKPTVKAISAAVGVDFQIISTDRSKLNQRTLPSPNPEPKLDSHTEIIGYQDLRGNDGVARFAIQTRTQAQILHDGETAVDKSLLFMVMFTGLSSLLGWTFIQLLVTKPLARLSREIGSIGDGNSRTVSTELVGRRDEIGYLARFLQGAFEQIEQAQISMVKASHAAGMASVAREVLHNAGNAFNSIRVAIDQLTENAKSSKFPRLSESLQLLVSQSHDLNRFTQEDEKGKRLIPYLVALNQHLTADHERTLEELTLLKTSVAHMGEVIQAQHSLANPSQEYREEFIAPIIDEATRIVAKSLSHHGVDLFVDVDSDLKGHCNSPLLIRVLVNLLTNAKDAVECKPMGQRLIEVRALRNAAGRIEIKVQDNGEGIAPEDATRIFANGFTTKAHGSGYGLHYCANTLTEMHWELTLLSNGPGQGATFTLTESKNRLIQEAA